MKRFGEAKSPSGFGIFVFEYLDGPETRSTSNQKSAAGPVAEHFRELYPRTGRELASSPGASPLFEKSPSVLPDDN